MPGMCRIFCTAFIPHGHVAVISMSRDKAVPDHVKIL